ncbi:hypothetical protein PybrP1_005349 [[Pythium] brassicae (nom. inval.)]|nr:hypothetical protein PybrP1_005349 [[Pythium] brassicae (nom. inval.)]
MADDRALEALAAQLQLGDVVRFNRGEYAHVALYAGDARVVHLWSPDAGGFCVRVDPLHVVARAHFFSDHRTSTAASARARLPERFSAQMDARMGGRDPLPGDEAVRRALSRLGAQDYDCVAYNCEHFVTWARYNKGASPQVASQANRIIAGALLGAAVGGFAGFVAGGVLSLVLRADALVASGGASGGSAAGALSAAAQAEEELVAQDQRRVDSEATAAASDSEEEEEEEEAADRDSEAERVAERARLWVEMDAIRPAAALRAQSEELAELYEWVGERRCRAAAASSRRYSDSRHVALATRLAEDDLLCGICFTDLQRVRAVAFSCDHFTCGVCFDALRENAGGLKSCPYCRLDIDAVDEIHKSTKTRAKASLPSEAFSS